MSTRLRSEEGARKSLASHRRALATLATLSLSLLLSMPEVARADDDALAPYRDRFRSGMEKYKDGTMGEAIRIWRAIYEEIGPERGYRLSFNLARAYDVSGEATRAAERYRSFLDEVDARSRRGLPVDPLVERERQTALERIDALNREHGRIEVAAAASRGAVLAQVDDTDPRLGAFTAYVAPGKHTVTFGPGQPDAERVEVTVNTGEIVVARPAPAPTSPPLPVAGPRPVDATPRRATHAPFSPVVLYASGVATAVSIVAPALAYPHAYSLLDTYNSTSQSPSARNSAGSQYPAARSLAYGMLAIPIGLGAVTGGLTAWYFAGAQTNPERVDASLVVLPGNGGASVSVSGRF